MSILSTISSPDDLRNRSLGELTTLCAEIREELIGTITQTGGHLGANLGTVELTVALHTVFEAPHDQLVWDVGHQAYVHKLLTGRLDRFGTIRQEGGISGFLSRDESPYDSFGAGHASTSISAALGMAVALSYQPVENRARAIAIVGDGALTGGMAFEGLNNAGSLHVPLIVVLNDNEMSIAPNVGALSKYLDRVRTEPKYRRAKSELSNMMERLPQGEFLVELGKRWKDSFKEFVYHSMIWEELGFTYVGPVDGHDLRALIEALRAAAKVDGPVFVHVVTQKGRGYDPAGSDRERAHAVSAPTKPSPNLTFPPAPKYQDVFADALIELARADDRIIGITAAMPSGTSMAKFQQAFPERFFDVGIAEQHAVTFAAGLATQGLRPVCAIYSTFLQRAYDQIVHDVAIQRLPVVFALDRAGFAGDDGRTHHGVFDLSYLGCIPNITIMAPKHEDELRHMVRTAIEHRAGPSAIRYPRGASVGVPISEPMTLLPIGRSEVLRHGSDVTLIGIGAMVYSALGAADLLMNNGIAATVVNGRFVKPLDTDLIRDLAETTGTIVTIEENVTLGGYGSAVTQYLANEDIPCRVLNLGLEDHFYDHASQGRLRDLAGLSPQAIADRVESLLTRTTPAAEMPAKQILHGVSD